MNNKKQAGVYQIRNLVNGKCYYGSSVDLNARRKVHFYELKKNYHYNNHLQRSYNKYGRKNFKWEILDIVPRNFEKYLEQWYLDTVVKWGKDYNMSKVVFGCALSLKIIYQFDLKGRFIKEWKSADEVSKFYNTSVSNIRGCCVGVTYQHKRFIWTYDKKEKLTTRINGLNNYKSRSKIIYQFSLNGSFKKSYKTAIELEKLGFNRSSISNCCTGVTLTSQGFIWLHKKENIQKRLLDIFNNKKSINTKRRNKNGKVYKYDLSGKFMQEYRNLIIAAKENNLDLSGLYSTIKGKHKTNGNFRWSKKAMNQLPPLKYTNRKKVDQFTLNGKFVKTYDSIHAAARATKANCKTISRVMRGLAKQSGGFKWKYNYE